MAFYTKNKFTKNACPQRHPSSYPSNQSKQASSSNYRKNTPSKHCVSHNHVRAQAHPTSLIICHYYHTKGHKAPKCHQRVRDRNNGINKPQANIVSQNEPLHLFSAVTQNNQDFYTNWYLDLGAIQYMLHVKSWFHNYLPLFPLRPIHMGDDAQLNAIGIG